ncbi:MAG: sensor histidine kinase, partial [Dehalococcoidia bacterium]
TMRQQLQDALEQVARANRELESRVRERTRQLQELVRRVLTAQEEERRRVALELHDETAQTLTALTVTLDSVVHRSERLTSEDASRLREAREIAAQMLEGLRRLIYALRPVALKEMGLAAALRWYAEDYLEHSGVAVHVSTGGTEASLPEHLEITLYRIGQEALNNVARHARARNVWITLRQKGSLVSLTVRDDGVGFNLDDLSAAVPRDSGVGLAGMRERASLAGGRLTIDSVLGTGTTVRVEVPIPADE